VLTIIDAGRTTSFALISGVTDLILTKVLHNVQESLLINLLQSKQRCSNSLHNASVQNKGQLSNCVEVAAKIPQTPFLNSEVSGPMFIKFLHNVAKLSPCDLFKAA